MFELEDFLNFARSRAVETDEPLPCEPEDYAAALGYLVAIVPEYRLARQADASGDAARRADRKQAIVNGFRRARGAPPAATGGDNGSGARDDAGASQSPTEAA